MVIPNFRKHFHSEKNSPLCGQEVREKFLKAVMKKYMRASKGKSKNLSHALMEFTA